MEEAELVKERLQAITVSLRPALTGGGGRLEERQTRAGWKHRTVTLHGRDSGALFPPRPLPP